MKFLLIIATTNQRRRKVLSSVIKTIYPDIKISNKTLTKTNVSLESHSAAKENAIEKVLFYSRCFKENILCEDDTLLIDNKEYSPHRNHYKYLSNVEIYNYWQAFIKKGEPIKGKLIKAFAFGRKGKIVSDQIEISIKLILPQNKPYRIWYNPLNYFIVPKGYSKPIAELNKKQLMQFRQLEQLLLKKILK